MRKAMAVLLIGASAVVSAGEQAAGSFDSERVSREDVQHLEAEVRAIPDVRCVEHIAPVTTCSSLGRHTNWQFTREGHAAHPAVVRNVAPSPPLPSVDGSSIHSVVSGQYAGDEQAYRQMESEAKAVQKWIDAAFDRILPHHGKPVTPPKPRSSAPLST